MQLNNGQAALLTTASKTLLLEIVSPKNGTRNSRRMGYLGWE
jgi:hypothetical protein